MIITTILFGQALSKEITVLKQHKHINSKLDSVIAELSTLQATIAYIVKQNSNLVEESRKANKNAQEINRTIKSWNDAMRVFDRFAKIDKSTHVRRGQDDLRHVGDIEITRAQTVQVCEDPLQDGDCRYIGPFTFDVRRTLLDRDDGDKIP